MMAGRNLTEEKIKNIAEYCLQEADEDKDGKLSKAEFQKVSILTSKLTQQSLASSDNISKLTIRF
jgi:hypothetical protein